MYHGFHKHLSSTNVFNIDNSNKCYLSILGSCDTENFGYGILKYFEIVNSF